MEFAATRKHNGPTTFDNYTRYMLWESGCTHSINGYFELYTHYKPLEKGYNIEVNGIEGLIKPTGIVTIVLDLEYDTGKPNNIYLKKIH